jgi:hypothetical protein
MKGTLMAKESVSNCSMMATIHRSLFFILLIVAISAVALNGKSVRAQKIGAAEKAASGGDRSAESGHRYVDRYDPYWWDQDFHGLRRACWRCLHHGYPYDDCAKCCYFRHNFAPCCAAYPTPDRSNLTLDLRIIETGYFLPYPYINQQSGSMIVIPERNYPAAISQNDKGSNSTPKQSDLGEPIDSYNPRIMIYRAAQPPHTLNRMIRVAPEYSYDFDGVHRASLYFHLSSSPARIGMEGGFSTYLEPRQGKDLDSLFLGDFNLMFRVFQLDIEQIYLGFGMRYMFGDKAWAGVNLAVRADIFPRKPIMISIAGDFGSIGLTYLVHGKFDLGLSKKGWEPYLGFDLLKIGQVNFYGPVIGLRKWL